jgi:ribosomal-protein-alanine N-acetyltransferase
MEAIETERLVVRNFLSEDWQALQAMIVAYQASDSARFEPAWPTSDKEMADIAAWFASEDNYLAVFLKAKPELIGLLAIEPRCNLSGQVRNLGYIFHPAFHGQGYAFEACRAIIDYLFAQLQIDSILSGTHPENHYSRRLLQKLALKQLSESEFALSQAEWRAGLPNF